MKDKGFKLFLREMALRKKAANTDKAYEFYEKNIKPLEKEHSSHILKNPNTALGRQYAKLLMEYRMISLDLKWDRKKLHKKIKAKNKDKDMDLD